MSATPAEIEEGTPDLDALLADVQDFAPPTLAGEPTELRKCYRHKWVPTPPRYLPDGTLAAGETICRLCQKVQDPVVSRRSRNNRKRGNRLQAQVAKRAGIANIGALGLPEDAGRSTDWLVVQVKSGGYYPRLMDRWLRALTATADQLRAVVLVETPGPGNKAKRLIVCDFDEFMSWYGK